MLWTRERQSSFLKEVKFDQLTVENIPGCGEL
jgi:hypothetical protein